MEWGRNKDYSAERCPQRQLAFSGIFRKFSLHSLHAGFLPKCLFWPCHLTDALHAEMTGGEDLTANQGIDCGCQGKWEVLPVTLPVYVSPLHTNKGLSCLAKCLPSMRVLQGQRAGQEFIIAVPCCLEGPIIIRDINHPFPHKSPPTLSHPHRINNQEKQVCAFLHAHPIHHNLLGLVSPDHVTRERLTTAC